MPEETYVDRSNRVANAVWIVDDDRSIRWVLEKALEKEGMVVSTFDRGNNQAPLSAMYACLISTVWIY